ncbi:chemotaxis protein CheB [Geobacter pickeringii]|uniref:chemotaxis protein CheB n=1 Tax=Geobacter pickeringii TaxID=345632 RepID=UPI00068B8F27|nr:chemotaxis protein CheB [Geobacter pickeringii]
MTTDRASAPLGVLIAAYSPWLRSLLTETVASQPGLAVTAAFPDLRQVRSALRHQRPDVLLLDMEMPHRDSVVFIEQLMRQRPMSVVVAAPLTEKSAYLTLRALEIGAADFIPVPFPGEEGDLSSYGETVAAAIRGAVRVRLSVAARRRGTRSAGMHGTLPVLPSLPAAAVAGKIIVVGSAAGGTESLVEFVSGLPSNFPPVVVAQPMPAPFSTVLARRLDHLGTASVREALEGVPLLSRHVYLSSGDRPLAIERCGSCFVARTVGVAPGGGSRSPVNLLFRSAARSAGEDATGVVLAGQGSDGREGVAELRRCGAFTIAQPQDECLAPEMPREAAAGGVAAVATVDEIPRLIARRLTRGEEAFAAAAVNFSY